MIAVDTNVLLRYLLQDDKAQAARADRLIRSSDYVLVTDTVLAETVWTLTGKRYSLDAESVAQVILALFEEPNIRFSDADAVWQALSDFQLIGLESQTTEVGFPDCLALSTARSHASAVGESFVGFYTFDKAAQKLAGAIPC